MKCCYQLNFERYNICDKDAVGKTQLEPEGMLLYFHLFCSVASDTSFLVTGKWNASTFDRHFFLRSSLSLFLHHYKRDECRELQVRTSSLRNVLFAGWQEGTTIILTTPGKNNDTPACIPKILLTNGVSSGSYTAMLLTHVSLWTEMNLDDGLMEREKEKKNNLLTSGVFAGFVMLRY